MSLKPNKLFVLFAAGLLMLAGGSLCAQQMDVTIRVPGKSASNWKKPEVGYMSQDMKTYYPGKNDLSFEQMIDVNYPGVKYTAGGQVVIRGQLCRYYQVDGGLASGLTAVDPLTVKSITIVKDPAETLIYGAKGRNGAVFVETMASSR